MKRALFAFAMTVLQYTVFYMIISGMFEDYSSRVAYCVMWLSVFASVIGLINDLLIIKFFTSRIENFNTVTKDNNPDLFDALVKHSQEEKERIKNTKDD